MSKINDNFKKMNEGFIKKVSNFQKQKPRKAREQILQLKNVENDVSSNMKRYSTFTGKNAFKVNLKEFNTSGVADTGFSQDALDNKEILYNSDANTTAPKKMRRIVSTQSSKTGSNGMLQGQSKIFGSMFGQQAKLMSKMHSESIALNSKFQNTLTEHVKNISDQVAQINKVKNTIQLDFYKNSMTTQNSILEELKSINSTLKTGFNLNPRGERESQRQADSLIKQVFAGGSLRGNTKKLVSNLAKEAFMSGTGGAGMALGLIIPLLQSQGGFKSILSVGAKEGMKYGANKMFGGSYAGRSALGLLGNPGQFLETMMNSWALGGGVKGWLGQRLGSNKKLDTDIDLSKYILKDRDTRTSFDNAAHTALTRVITRSLANIESSLTGKAAMYYNYASNRFQTLEDAKQSMKTSYSSLLNEQMKYAQQELTGGKVTKKKDIFGNEYDEVGVGVFADIMNLDDVNDANLNFLKKMIKYRGPQLADGLMKMILYFSERASDPGRVLDVDSLDLRFIVKVLYSKEILEHANKAQMDKYLESADHMRRFLTTFRSLPGKKARELWEKLLRIFNETRDGVVRAAEEAFEDAEGGVAQWAAYTYGEVWNNGKMRGKTRRELDKEFDKNNKTPAIKELENLAIDLTGVMNSDDLDKRITSEYNKMCAPLFMGSVDKIRSNLKAKLSQLKKANHAFAPYLEKTVNAFDKGGKEAFERVDYATLAGISSYSDLMEDRGPKFNGKTRKDAVKSASEIAKWHLANNNKVRGIVGTGAAAGYGMLVKEMFQSSGMTGPFASSIIGIGAATTAVLSGKMSKIMDVMTTELGDEKMKDKDGNETSVTKRQAMQEAMYREFLPKAWGLSQGAKIGGWVRNNVRLGPILGPVVGMTTGWILGGAASWILKLGGLFAKFGKGLLNKLGKKITGNADTNWGDNIRDIFREKAGFAEAGSPKFTMQEIYDQAGSGSKTDYAVATLTGQSLANINARKQAGPQAAASYEEMYYAKKRALQARIDHEKNLSTTGYTSKINFDDTGIMSEVGQGLNLSKDILEPIRTNTLNVRLVGGHLDTIGVVGMVDAEAYKNKVQAVTSKSTVNAKKQSPDADTKGVQKMASTSVLALKQATQFNTTDPEAKDEIKDQDRQEEIEEQNKENLEKIAIGAGKKTNEKEDTKKKAKKKGFVEALTGLFQGDISGENIQGVLGPVLKGAAFTYMFFPQIKDALTNFLPNILNYTMNGVVNTGKNIVNTAKKGVSTWWNSYKEKGGKISAGIDLIRFAKDAKSQKLLWNVAKGTGKTALAVAKHIPIVGGITKLGLGAAGLGVKGVKAAGNVAKVGGQFLKNKWANRAAQWAGKYSDDAAELFMKHSDKLMRYGREGVLKGGENLAKNLGKKATGETLEKTVSMAAKNGTKIGKIGNWVLKAIDMLDKVLFKIPGFEKIAKKITGTFIPGMKKLAGELMEKISGKLVKEGGEKAAKKGFLGALKGGLTLSGIGIAINIGFIAWDAWQGAKKAKDFFDTDNPTATQKYACAITYATFSLIESIPGCMIVTAIVSAIDGIMQWFCRRTYEILNTCLKAIGMGDSVEEEERYRLLLEGDKPEDDGGMGSGEKGKGQYELTEERMKNEQDPHGQQTSTGYTYDDGQKQKEEQVKEMFKYYGELGGSGGSGSTTSLSGRTSTGNAPMFYSQYNLPAGRLGNLDLQEDGCALAVMKMIAAHKGIHVTDDELISKANDFKLSNGSVSVGFFDSYGGNSTSNKDDIRRAIASPNACLALLIYNQGSKHFIAVIAKDKNTVYVGDPLKQGWEELPNTDNKFLSYSIAASIFSGAIVTGIGTPGLRKQGGTGATGGFGSKGRDLIIKGVQTVKEKVKNVARNIASIFNNDMDESETTTTTNSNGGISGAGVFDGGSVVMPHGPVVEVLDRSKYGGGKMDNVVKYKDGTIAMRHGNVGWRMFNPDSHDAGSEWAIQKFGALPPKNGDRQVTYPSPAHADAAQNFMLFQKPDAGSKRRDWTGMTFKEFVSTYAPKSDGNDEAGYVRTLEKTTGLPSSTRLQDLTPDQRITFLRGVRLQEIGTDTKEKLIDYYAGKREAGTEKIIQQGTNSAKSQGGSGGPQPAYMKYLNNEEVQYYGRGIGVSSDSLKACFVKQKDVGTVLGLNGKENTTCGIACALMVQKLVFFNDHKKFDAKVVKRYADGNKLFDKDLGVSQRFFLGFGMQKYDIDKIRASVGKVKIGTFADQDRKGNAKKWGIQNHEIAILNAGGHWVVIVRQGGVPWILDPMQNGPLNLFERRDLAQLEVDYGVHSKDSGRIVNMLMNSTSHIAGLSSGAEGKTKKGAPIAKEDTSNDNSGENSAADPTGLTTDNANGESSTPIKGTSASFGGWFFKGEDGQLKQFFFGSKATKGGNNNGVNTAGGTSFSAGALGLPGSCDAVSGVERDKISPPGKDTPAYKAAEVAVQKFGNNKMQGKCAYGVMTSVATAFGKNYSSLAGNANQFLGASRVTGRSDDGSRANVLKQLGYTTISVTSTPAVGDILVFNDPRVSGWYGHITMLAANGQWISDGLQQHFYVYHSPSTRSSHPNFATTKSSKPEDAKYTLWRYTGTGGDATGNGDKPKGLKEYKNNNKSANYYSTGSSSYRVDKLYKDTVDSAFNSPDEPGVLVSEIATKDSKYRTFRISSNAERNANAAYRDTVAKARYDRHMRTRNEEMNLKKFGQLNVTYTDSDDVLAKALSVASGAVQDINSDNEIVNVLTKLTGAITDSTVQNKLGTQKIIEQQEKQIEAIKDNIEETNNIQKNTEKSVKNAKRMTIIPPQTQAEIEANFALIKQAEKEMFIGLVD